MTSTELALTVIVAAIGSAGFWDFLKWILSKTKKKKHTSQEEALLAILHDRLYYLLSKYITQTQIEADDYDNLLHLYEAYRALDGNGLIQRMFEQVSRLPIC